MEAMAIVDLNARYLCAVLLVFRPDLESFLASMYIIILEDKPVVKTRHSVLDRMVGCRRAG